MLKVCASPIFESAMYVSGASPVEVSRAQFALLSPVVSARAVTLYASSFGLANRGVCSKHEGRSPLTLSKMASFGPSVCSVELTSAE